jgi:hypothetical protein
MKCSNCQSNCPSFDLTNSHCGDTMYEIGDRVKVTTDEYTTWGAIEGLDRSDEAQPYMIRLDGSEKQVWPITDEVTHKLKHEVA